MCTLWLSAIIVNAKAAFKPNIAQRDDELFPVSIVHINDFHARSVENKTNIYFKTSSKNNQCEFVFDADSKRPMNDQLVVKMGKNVLAAMHVL